MADERELDFHCSGTPENPTWRVDGTERDVTTLVEKIRALQDFQPPIGGMQSVRIKVTDITTP